MGHPAEGCFLANRASPRPIDNPFEYAHVLAIPGPKELALVILPEPVHMKHPRCQAQVSLQSDPMSEILAHVVTAEREHCHGIAPYFTNRAGSCRRYFRPHRSTD